MNEKGYVATLRAIRDRLGNELAGASNEDRRRRVRADIEQCPELARILQSKLDEVHGSIQRSDPGRLPA